MGKKMSRGPPGVSKDPLTPYLIAILKMYLINVHLLHTVILEYFNIKE
jgi:hypothetical protein